MNTGEKAEETRVAAADWTKLAAELDAYGCALTPQLLTPEECAEISALYDEAGFFRATIDMERHRFGAGQYRYFDHPLPPLVDRLRAAFYPRLLPIARDWAARLGQPAPGRTTSASGSTCATGPARPGRRPSCCATARTTGTRSTATCTGTWCSRCRW